jgi:integrase/recombinase XerD
MSGLSTHVNDYLRLRRALGFKLEREGQWLAQLAAFVDATGAVTLTSELAIAWARQAASGPNRSAKRPGVARKFAVYLQTIAPATEVPPPGVFPARRHRPTLPVVAGGHLQAAGGRPRSPPTLARRDP